MSFSFCRGLFTAHVCTGYYFFILLNWIPTYFTEVYPGHQVCDIIIQFLYFFCTGLLMAQVCKIHYLFILLNWIPTDFHILQRSIQARIAQQ